MLFDGDGNRMTPSHAIRKGTRYRYYVSHGLITKDQSERSAGLRTPAGEIEQVVTSRARQWLLDPGSIYQATRVADPSGGDGALGVTRLSRAIPTQRNRWFADSPLEGTGFEPPVPPPKVLTFSLRALAEAGSPATIGFLGGLFGRSEQLSWPWAV